MTSDREEILPDPIRNTLERAIICGLPAESVAVYARWWQLETWLRTIAYLELRTAYGSEWREILEKRALSRQESESPWAYMPSSDSTNPLAYMDVGPLVDLIEADWSLFERTLLPRSAWAGRMDELRQVRNRLAHCRRPHVDDRGRIEQLLRDLDARGRQTLIAYNRVELPDADRPDPVVRAWVGREHPDAQRLIDHAAKAYDTRLILGYSIRPWVPAADRDRVAATGVVTGESGYVWSARFLTHGRLLDPAVFWRSDQLDSIRDSLVHVIFEGPALIRITFAAVDRADAVADAIGVCFDTILTESRRIYPDTEIHGWAESARGLDDRLQAETAMALLDANVDMTLFAA